MFKLRTKLIAVGICTALLCCTSVYLSKGLLTSQIKVKAYGSVDQLQMAYPDPDEETLKDNMFLVDGHMYIWTANEGWKDTGAKVGQTTEEIVETLLPLTTNVIDESKQHYQVAVMSGYKGTYTEFMELVKSIAEGKTTKEIVNKTLVDKITHDAYIAATDKGYSGSEIDFARELLTSLNNSDELADLLYTLSYSTDFKTLNGEDGKAGLDAYIVAVAKGYTKSYDDFNVELQNTNSVQTYIQNIKNLNADLNNLCETNKPEDITSQVKQLTSEVQSNFNNLLALIGTNKSLAENVEVVTEIVKQTLAQQAKIISQCKSEMSSSNSSLATGVKENLDTNISTLQKSYNAIVLKYNTSIVETQNYTLDEISKITSESIAKSSLKSEEATKALQDAINAKTTELDIINKTRLDESVTLYAGIDTLVKAELENSENLSDRLAEINAEILKAEDDANAEITNSLNASVESFKSKINLSKDNLILLSSYIKSMLDDLNSYKDALVIELADLKTTKLAQQGTAEVSWEKDLDVQISAVEEYLANAESKIETLNPVNENVDLTLSTAVQDIANNITDMEETLKLSVVATNSSLSQLINSDISAKKDDLLTLNNLITNTTAESVTSLKSKLTDTLSPLTANLNILNSTTEVNLNEITDQTTSIENLKTTLDSNKSILQTGLADAITNNKMSITADKYWQIGNLKTAVKASGTDGKTGWSVGAYLPAPAEDTSKANWHKVTTTLEPAVVGCGGTIRYVTKPTLPGYNWTVDEVCDKCGQSDCTIAGTGSKPSGSAGTCTKQITLPLGSPTYATDAYFFYEVTSITSDVTYLSENYVTWNDYGKVNLYSACFADAYAIDISTIGWDSISENDPCAGTNYHSNYATKGHLIAQYGSMKYYSAPVFKDTCPHCVQVSVAYKGALIKSNVPFQGNSSRSGANDYSFNWAVFDDVGYPFYLTSVHTGTANQGTLQTLAGASHTFILQNASTGVTKNKLTDSLTNYQKYKLTSKGLNLAALPTVYANQYIYCGTPYAPLNYKVTQLPKDLEGGGYTPAVLTFTWTNAIPLSGTYRIYDNAGVALTSPCTVSKSSLTFGFTLPNSVKLNDTVKLVYTPDADSFAKSEIVEITIK